MLLQRADPNQKSSWTLLHTVVARGGKEHVPFAEMPLDAGARMDIRDDLLKALPWGGHAVGGISTFSTSC
jgi:hypothetical protein